MFIELTAHKQKHLINVNHISSVYSNDGGGSVIKILGETGHTYREFSESYETVKEMIGYKDFIVTAETVRVHKHLTERHEKKNARRLTLNDSEHDPDHDLQ